MGKRPNDAYAYFSAFSMTLLCFSSGVSSTWSSPLLPRFESDDPTVNPVGRPLTTTESGLLVSIINLGLFIGPFVSGPIVGKLAKKYTILMFGVPMFVSHAICAFAANFPLFFVARLMMGVSIGAFWSILPGYLSEISLPKNRGLLNSSMLSMSCLGTMYTYAVAPFVSVRVFSLLNLIPTGAFLLLVWLFAPASPYDLVAAKRLSEARASLVKLRRTTDVDKELLEIEKVIETTAQDRTIGIRELFRNDMAVAALRVCVPLMVFNAFSGMYVVLSYTQTIFEIAESSLPATYSAMLVGAVCCLAAFVSMNLLDALGRRPIMIVSALLAVLSHTVLGVFFVLQAYGLATPAIGWIPIASIMTFMFSYYFGLSSLPWIILGETFASCSKAAASTFCAGLNFLLVFLTTLVYPYSVQYIGIANTYFVFAIMMGICLVFSILKVPETKGKLFSEIFDSLNSEKR